MLFRSQNGEGSFVAPAATDHGGGVASGVPGIREKERGKREDREGEREQHGDGVVIHARTAAGTWRRGVGEAGSSPAPSGRRERKRKEKEKAVFPDNPLGFWVIL